MLVALAACRHPAPESDPKAETQARYVMGQPEDVPIQSQDQAVMTSDPLARRRASWRLFQLVNRAVELRDPRTNAPIVDVDGKALTLPLWQTWYSMTEFRALMATMLGRLDGSAAPTPELVADVLRDHHRRVLDDAYWTEVTGETTRLDRFIDAIDAQTDGRGLGGPVGRGQTLFSPALISHLLLNYRVVLACAMSPAVAEANAEVIFGSCVGGPFPANAIAIKANWVKVADTVPAFDTGPEIMRKILAGEAPEWVSSESIASPTSILVAGRLQNLKKHGIYRLVGLHITSKETPEWLWDTFWWSPKPEQDWGADNPIRGTAHTYPELASYKMCTVANFSEVASTWATQPSTPGEETVMEMIKIVREAGSGASWCSNPYIETQTGGANSNCIGCHQHAGPDRGEFEEDVGKVAVRTTFPADLLWSFDSFKESFKDEVVRVVNENAGP